MNIYLPADLRKAWEGSWIKFLLGDSYHSAEYYEDSDFPIVNNSFYVTLYNTDYKKNIKSMIERKYTFGIFLLSDEFLTDKCEYVSEPECKFVIRNYIHPNLYQNPKVVHIGLGFKKNFDKYVQKNEFIERGYTWNFIGSVHGNSRNQAVNVFSHLDGGFIHKTKHFNSDDYLSTEEYCEVLSQSLYTICPQGHANNETFRIFEALEAGSIPVVLKNSEAHPFNPGYWNYLFTGEPFFPFVVADDWESARHTVTTDIKNGLTALRQKQCQLFWSKWKATWKYQLHAKLSSLA
jgi:hypothetical protein